MRWSLHLGQGGDPEKSDFFVGFHGSNPDSCDAVPATFEAQINSSCSWKWMQRCCESLHCPCSWLWLPFKAPNYIYIYTHIYTQIFIHIIMYYEVVTQFAWYGFSTTSKLHELNLYKEGHSPFNYTAYINLFLAKQANLRSDLTLNSRRLVAKRWS